MDPITISALAMAGASGANAAATGAQNRKSRAFSREMYQQQKADNIAFWNMQNEYNSPEKQMERLKNAGLNPNMLYDKTGAVIPAGNISTPDVQSAQFRTPDFGSIGSSLVQGYFDTKIKQAQYDNLKAQNTVAKQEALLKAAQTEGESVRTYGKGLENYVLRENTDALARGATLDNEKKIADIKFTNDENARKAALASPNLQQAILNVARTQKGLEIDEQQIEKLKQDVYNSKQEGIIKNVQAEFAKMGVNFNDPIVMRWIGDFIGGFVTGDQSKFSQEGLRLGKSFHNFRKGF